MQAIRSRPDAIRAAQAPSVPSRARDAFDGPSTRAQAAAKEVEGGQAPSCSSSPYFGAPASSNDAVLRRSNLTIGEGVDARYHHRSSTTTTTSTRRQALVAAAVTAVGAALIAPSAARAAAADAGTAAAAPSTTTTLLAPASSDADPSFELFLDNDWSISYPRGYTFREDLLAPPPRDPSRPGGPAPARSPVRARFDAHPLPSTGAPAALLSVIVRQAQSLRPTVVQVTDISAYGPPEEAAKLLLPRGARLVAASQAQEALPPRETPLGPVEIPPVNYYYYEFIAPGGGERAVLAAAAARGKVYVAGGSAGVAEPGGWEAQSGALAAAVRTFRLRNQVALALEQVQQQEQQKKKSKE